MKINTLNILILFTCAFFPFATLSFAQEPPLVDSSLISVESGKVNINTADATTLSTILKGIGLKKAEAIIEYRNTFGPFKSIHELEAVSGIGKSTVERNASLIAIK